MASFSTPGRIIITCSKRLAPYLEIEIAEFGLNIVRTFSTGVELSGTLNDCIKLNLNLRCASQVLYSLKSFSCINPFELYDKVSQIEWEGIIKKMDIFQ